MRSQPAPLALLTFCSVLAGSGAAVAASVPDDTAGWSFTDDQGQTIELDAIPSRVVMFEDVAASLMDLGVQPVGIDYLSTSNHLLDDFDLDGIETVGDNCGEINMEAVAAAEPDLFVYMYWGDAGDDSLFCLPANVRHQLESFAPVVVISAEGSAGGILDRYVELARALGADLDSPEVAAKRQRYDEATQRLQAAVADRPEISVIPESVAPNYFGIAEPAGFADLTWLRDSFGIDFAGPFQGQDFTGVWFEEFSSELATEYRGDVIMMDAKNATPLDAKLDAFPLWAQLPEVAAGQIVDWWVPGSFSYTRDAEFMEALAGAIESAEDFVTET